MSAPGDKSAPADGPAPPRRRWPVRFFHQRPRLSVAAAVFVLATGALTWAGVHPVSAVLFGFDLGALVFLAGLVLLFNHSTPAHMRDQALAQDTGRWGLLWSSVVLAAVVMVALGAELHSARAGGAAAIAGAALSIVLSWLFINTMFALHYAHGYYGDYGVQHQGLDFPKTDKPDYWDFAYFAICIGMTFQVSDVQITSRYLRRVVLLHSVIAFFFNVFIIALSVNIVASQG